MAALHPNRVQKQGDSDPQVGFGHFNRMNSTLMDAFSLSPVFDRSGHEAIKMRKYPAKINSWTYLQATDPDCSKIFGVRGTEKHKGLYEYADRRIG